MMFVCAGDDLANFELRLVEQVALSSVQIHMCSTALFKSHTFPTTVSSVEKRGEAKLIRGCHS